MNTLPTTLVMRLALVTFAMSFFSATMSRAQVSLPTQIHAQIHSPMHSEHACDARENLDGFPQSLRFWIVSQDELDARGIDRQQKESDTSRLRRVEFPTQPKTGVFSVSGFLGISGDAKLLVTKDALRFGEVGMVMIVNHSMRETVIYQCRRITP